jgi:hypothetical protein
MSEKVERRGRPTEAPVVVLEKFERNFFQYANEQYQKEGTKTTWFHDVNKNSNGPYKVEKTFPKGHKFDKVKPEKSKAYSKQPVVMVFKSSERANAKYKIKVWNNENIDFIITAPTLPGVPDTAIILETAVGESFIDIFKSKYSL